MKINRTVFLCTFFLAGIAFFASGVEAKGFTWKENPAIKDIPKTPLVAEANGKPMEINTVVIEPSPFKEGWRIILAEAKLKSPTDFIMDGQSISFDVSLDDVKKKKVIRAMKYGDGYFQINDPKTKKSTSWNADNAYALEISGWKAKPFDPKGQAFQVAGSATIKIALVYKGTTSFANSWAAGVYKNAIIRYKGKPSWMKDDAKAEKKADKKK